MKFRSLRGITRVTVWAAGALALASVAVTATGCGGGSSSAAQTEFRAVAERTAGDSRYSRVESQVIDSRAELEQVLDAAGFREGEDPAASSDPFIRALLAANISYDREALVLLRYTETGASLLVSLDPPLLQGKTFVPTIRTIRSPATGSIGVDIHHVWAFVVSRDSIDAVRAPVVYTDQSGTQTIQTISLTVPN